MGALAGKLHPQGRPAAAPRGAAPKLEADGVKGTICGQIHARRIAPLRIPKIRIAQVAVQAQGLVLAAGFCRTRQAAARESISQRQPAAVRPELAWVRLGRNEVGASQRTLSLPNHSTFESREGVERLGAWVVVQFASGSA
jgi:hypothetical protein